MKILVTAFGPFGGRSGNASSLALRELKIAFPEIHTRILPVDSVVAPVRLKQALRQLRPGILIMLGEAAGSKVIRLETTAWNELDFTIPDIAGRQPLARPVLSKSPAALNATLPLEEIHASLVSLGHQAVLSDDAGRYLCNQLSFVALDYLQRHAIPCAAGFIHLPLAEDYPTDRATAVLGHVIHALRQS